MKPSSSTLLTTRVWITVLDAFSLSEEKGKAKEVALRR